VSRFIADVCLSKSDIKRLAALRRSQHHCQKIEKSLAWQLFRSAADELTAKMPPCWDAPLSVMVTVYSSKELLLVATQLAAQLTPAMNYKPNV